jgi:selenocysteine-specific elongation factor
MKHLIIGTAGHIDHGKTALIKMLTGIDCDTHKEEKARGITINLGFSHVALPSGESAGIIDVPGHKDFINTMIGGASGIDMVLLVIAADSGIMPQTIEHINIITTLGIDKGVVALTKSDLVDEELIEIAGYEISELLNKTSLKDAPIVGVSAITWKGKDDLLQAIDQVVSEIEAREQGNLFRMYIDRIFTVKGFGSVVTGSVLSGSVSTGDDVFLLPGDKLKLRVRSIERHGNAVDKVVRGDRAAINLIGLKNDGFERGMIICDKQMETTTMVDAFVTIFKGVSPLQMWSDITIISGTFECMARMHLLNKDQIEPGGDAIVQLHLSKPAILLNKDKFIIRNSSADLTLGGGYIIDAFPLHHRKRTPALVEYLRGLRTGIMKENSTSENIGMILKREFKPFNLTEISDKLNLKPEDLNSYLNHQQGQFVVYENPGDPILIWNEYDKAFVNKVVQMLKDHHAKNPIFTEGLESGEISGKLGLTKMRNGKAYLENLLKKMKSGHLIETHQNTWIIAGHHPLIDKKIQSEIDWLEETVLAYKDEKPVQTEIEKLASEKNISKQKVKMYLSLLAGKGKIRIYNNDCVHTQILEEYRTILLKYLTGKPDGISIQDYKSVLGGTKPFRALLGDIFESEKIIQYEHGSGVDTRIMITPSGLNLMTSAEI